MQKLYNYTPDGYCGDEDNGQTSAWYVFSAMGFYPVCPGTDQYVFGSPLFRRMEITMENGRIQQDNFHNYRLASLGDSPRIVENYIVDSPHPPAGVGEPPISPLAPALTNAIFAATGKRIRELPIADQLA